MEQITKLGVFDSGLGGLTVLDEICKYNKGLSISYFGDTARVPYGSRTPETIARYAEQDVRFLLSCGVEAIVIACGTVSATCLNRLRSRYRIPIVGVIEPAAEAAAMTTQTKHIGVLGTRATIHSGAYSDRIRSLSPDCRVTGIACPLFVPLIENGFTEDDPITEMTLERYLGGVRESDIDTLILGCTHYPFLKDAIQRFLPNVTLINIGSVLAKALPNLFPIRPGAEQNAVSYFVSDTDSEFQQIANAYLDEIRAHDVHKINIELY